jgi:selenocysteine lyase/cysteine desulfurase
MSKRKDHSSIILWVKQKNILHFDFCLGVIFCFCEMNGKQESNKWAEPYAISTNGSPLYYEEEGGGSVEESEPEMLDDNNGVTCSGLDHADSQGLNKITRRLRYLTNWVISALLKLHHPAQAEGQGTPLVHIYGPEVQFDRGASLAFNILDQNGVVVQPKLVQQLADQSNISLGLGKLCNIIYPEGLRGFRGLHLTEKTVAPGGKTDGQFENPRASNANKGDRPLSIPVVTAALGFVTNFEDVYRLWAFVAKFLDVNFVSERGELATAVPLTFNQETVVL